jgi:hypothetical protein
MHTSCISKFKSIRHVHHTHKQLNLITHNVYVTITYTLQQIVVRTLLDIMPDAGQYLLLLVTVMYTVCAAGVELFGGKICTEPGNRYYELLKDTEYAQNDYWPMNFNGKYLQFTHIYVVQA